MLYIGLSIKDICFGLENLEDPGMLSKACTFKESRNMKCILHTDHKSSQNCVPCLGLKNSKE